MSFGDEASKNAEMLPMGNFIGIGHNSAQPITALNCHEIWVFYAVLHLVRYRLGSSRCAPPQPSFPAAQVGSNRCALPQPIFLNKINRLRGVRLRFLCSVESFWINFAVNWILNVLR